MQKIYINIIDFCMIMNSNKKIIKEKTEPFKEF